MFSSARGPRDSGMRSLSPPGTRGCTWPLSLSSRSSSVKGAYATASHRGPGSPGAPTLSFMFPGVLYHCLCRQASVWWQRLVRCPGTHFCSQLVTGGAAEGRTSRGWDGSFGPPAFRTSPLLMLCVESCLLSLAAISGF